MYFHVFLNKARKRARSSPRMRLSLRPTARSSPNYSGPIRTFIGPIYALVSLTEPAILALCSTTRLLDVSNAGQTRHPSRGP